MIEEIEEEVEQLVEVEVVQPARTDVHPSLPMPQEDHKDNTTETFASQNVIESPKKTMMQTQMVKQKRTIRKQVKKSSESTAKKLQNIKSTEPKLVL